MLPTPLAFCVILFIFCSLRCLCSNITLPPVFLSEFHTLPQFFLKLIPSCLFLPTCKLLLSHFSLYFAYFSTRNSAFFRSFFFPSSRFLCFFQASFCTYFNNSGFCLFEFVYSSASSRSSKPRRILTFSALFFFITQGSLLLVITGLTPRFFNSSAKSHSCSQRSLNSIKSNEPD